MPGRINIAVSGGPGTGKSTLAAGLFAKLKVTGLDYDLIAEERRKLMDEMGEYRSPFERIYIWRQQEREELRSTADDGFITDTPLFHLYIQGKTYAKESRDLLAVRELLRMCLELRSCSRYQIVVVPTDPDEVAFRNDHVRTGSKEDARRKHKLIRSYIEHFWTDELLFVHGTLEARIEQVCARLQQLRILK